MIFRRNSTSEKIAGTQHRSIVLIIWNLLLGYNKKNLFIRSHDIGNNKRTVHIWHKIQQGGKLHRTVCKSRPEFFVCFSAALLSFASLLGHTSLLLLLLLLCPEEENVNTFFCVLLFSVVIELNPRCHQWCLFSSPVVLPCMYYVHHRRQRFLFCA